MSPHSEPSSSQCCSNTMLAFGGISLKTGVKYTADSQNSFWTPAVLFTASVNIHKKWSMEQFRHAMQTVKKLVLWKNRGGEGVPRRGVCGTSSSSDREERFLFLGRLECTLRPLEGFLNNK